MAPTDPPPPRETDDYVGASTRMDDVAEIAPWIRNIVQPLVVGVMVGSIAYAAAQFLHLLYPGWSRLYFIVTPVLAALLGHSTNRIAQRRRISGGERLRFQIVELALMFVVLKLLGYLDNTLPEIWAEIRAWPQDWLMIFDTRTMIAFALSTAAWYLGWSTVDDLEEFADPFIYQGRDFNRPVQRIIRRFFVGGALLLLFSGAAYTEYIALLGVERRRAPGLALNALIYVLGGLLLVGQLRLGRLVRVWRAQRTRFTSRLSRHWIRYSLILLGVVLLIAFLLPTGYTLGFMDLVSLIVTIVTYILSILYFLLLLPLAFLISLFTKDMERVAPPSPPTRPNVEPATPAAESAPAPWLEVLRSVVFWVVIVGVLVYIVRSYLRDRPDLWQTLRRFRPVRWLEGIWTTLRRWWRGLREEVREQVSRVVKRLRRARARVNIPGLGRRRGESLREQIFYHYLNTLDRAEAEGYPRQASETPYEYRQHLAPELSDAEPEIAELTETFVEARYSTHPLSDEALDRLRAAAQRIQDALRRRKADAASEEQDEET